MGPSTATNGFSGSAAEMRVRFNDTGILQPLIADSGVVNAATYLPGPGIAPGSYVSIFGANLSLGSGSAFTSRLPVSINTVSVSFDVPEAGLSVPGHLIYVSPRQVNVQVPWELRGQTSVRMKVDIQSASGAVFTVPVTDYSPGIFADSSGGLAVTRGSTISLYGTGFGPVNHQPASGDPAPDASSTTLVVPTVTVGGVPAKVEFSGLAPGYAGLYQVNVTIPPDAPVGLQQLTVAVNGVAANSVQLPLQ